MSRPDIDKLQKMISKFSDERDWGQFHTPKNLSMALSVETSELMEIFQWLTAKESFDVMKSSKREAVEDELADIFVYLLRICELLEVDIEKSILNKISKNSRKYPVDKSKGNCLKYDEL